MHNYMYFYVPIFHVQLVSTVIISHTFHFLCLSEPDGKVTSEGWSLGKSREIMG